MLLSRKSVNRYCIMFKDCLHLSFLHVFLDYIHRLLDACLYVFVLTNKEAGIWPLPTHTERLPLPFEGCRQCGKTLQHCMSFEKIATLSPFEQPDKCSYKAACLVFFVTEQLESSQDFYSMRVQFFSFFSKLWNHIDFLVVQFVCVRYESLRAAIM